MDSTARDILALHGLLAEYCHTFSRRDADAWVALFTPDGTWERAVPSSSDKYNEYVRCSGHAELRQLALDSFAAQGTVQYIAANSMIHVDEDAATGVSTAFIIGVSDASPHIVIVGNFADRYIRTQTGWKFASRSITLLN